MDTTVAAGAPIRAVVIAEVDGHPRVDVVEAAEDGGDIVARDNCEGTGGTNIARSPFVGYDKHRLGGRADFSESSETKPALFAGQVVLDKDYVRGEELRETFAVDHCVRYALDLVARLYGERFEGLDMRCNHYR